MHAIVKSIIKTLVRHNVLISLKNKKLLINWIRCGRPTPPPHIVKQLVVKKYQKKYSFNIFIETGTYLGEMVEAQKHVFSKIYSIELQPILLKEATEKFKNDKNVFLIEGDSGKVLPKLMNELDGPAIFWLDGHYSGNITALGDKVSPIFEEIDAILSNKKYRHILLIDDARLFDGGGDYPSVVDLEYFIKSKNTNYLVEIKDDIIRCSF